ncbi:MAG: DUF2007 domain-containing protein [Fimbriimonadaceae bacterium]|nr:DUF2007 domain-containing protein [Alphaproteobacteria bacterium]
MRELLRTNDPTEISFVEYLLKQAGIYYMVLDTNMSVLDGSIGALPRRILVADDGWQTAREVMRNSDVKIDEQT